MSLPTPYYEEDGITIFNCDCREILPHLPKVDLVLTDPPYPGLSGGIEHFNGGGVSRNVIHGSVTVGTPWDTALDEWLPAALDRSTQGAFVFCSYHSVSDVRRIGAIADEAYLLTWYKRNSPVSVCNVPRFTSEYVWAFKTGVGLRWRELGTTVLDFPALQSGCMAVERILDKSGKSAHPTQKPLALVKYLLRVGGASILDPFIGSGTTLVAAKQLGRRAIGIEIDEAYCAIAVERLRQSVFRFEEPDPQPEQLALDEGEAA